MLLLVLHSVPKLSLLHENPRSIAFLVDLEENFLPRPARRGF